MKKYTLWIILLIVVALFALLVWWVNNSQIAQINTTVTTPVQNTITGQTDPILEIEATLTDTELEENELREVVDESGETFVEPIPDSSVSEEEVDPADQDVINQ